MCSLRRNEELLSDGESIPIYIRIGVLNPLLCHLDILALYLGIIAKFRNDSQQCVVLHYGIFKAVFRIFVRDWWGGMALRCGRSTRCGLGRGRGGRGSDALFDKILQIIKRFHDLLVIVQSLFIHFFDRFLQFFYSLLGLRIVVRFSLLVDLVTQGADILAETGGPFIMAVKAFFDVLQTCIDSFLPLFGGFPFGNGGGSIISSDYLAEWKHQQ